MSQQMVWRTWCYRTAQAHERLLRLATRAGFCGLGAAMLLHLLLPGLDQWGLLLLGGSLIPVGVGHALVGEWVNLNLQEGEMMPSAARILFGLLIACGGVLIALRGL